MKTAVSETLGRQVCIQLRFRIIRINTSYWFGMMMQLQGLWFITDASLDFRWNITVPRTIVVSEGIMHNFIILSDCYILKLLRVVCPDVSDLSRGVGFRHRDYSGFIFPSGEQRGGNSIIWLITKEIRDTRSPLLDESRQLYNNYNELSKRFQE